MFGLEWFLSHLHTSGDFCFHAMCVIVWFIYWIFNFFQLVSVTLLCSPTRLTASLNAIGVMRKNTTSQTDRELLTNDYLHFAEWSCGVHWQVDRVSRRVNESANMRQGWERFQFVTAIKSCHFRPDTIKIIVMVASIIITLNNMNHLLSESGEMRRRER